MKQFCNSILALILCATTAIAPALLPGAGVVAIGGLAMTQTACSATTIITDITKFTPVLVSILQIIAAENGMNTTGLQQKVAIDSADAQQLVSDYVKQGSVGIWNNMNAALNVLSADAALVFQMSNVVSGPSQAKIGLIVASGEALFAIIESLIPAAPAQPVNGGLGAVTVTKHFEAYAPTTKLTLGEWTTSWNKLMTSKSGDAKLDALTPKMQIHLHSWAVRHITFQPGR